MKRIFIIVLIFISTSFTANSAVNVMCDVIYKNSEGEWSDFLRTRVTFCLGHEINEVLESRSVFAIILSPDNQRIILKMKGSNVQVQELDMFNTLLLLCSNDMINRGIDFELYRASIIQEWKIYPKDEIGLLIDQNLCRTETGRIYNEGILNNRENGFKIDRVKPKDDPKHLGDTGEIVYKDHWSFYIIKVKDRYLAMERGDFTIMKSEIGEKIVGDFSVSSQRKVFYNKTRDVDGYKFSVLKEFDTYEDCEKYIKTQWPY